MGTPQKEPLRAITASERRALERVSRATSERVDRVRRARALLAVADGKPFAPAARQAGFRSGAAVAALVRRFNRNELAALTIASGRGRKPTYDKQARSRIVARAQRPPDRREDGTATWSLSTLERRLRRDGLAKVGATTIRRVLHEAGASYQRTRTWCPTGTAQRQRKSGAVTVVDPQTEEKRGGSNKRTGKPKRPG
jgi:transposase